MNARVGAFAPTLLLDRARPTQRARSISNTTQTILLRRVRLLRRVHRVPWSRNRASAVTAEQFAASVKERGRARSL